MNSEKHEYKGHHIELRSPEPELEILESSQPLPPELFIDGKTVLYGRFPGGLYAIHENAFEWGEELLDVARKFIDYREHSINEISDTKLGKED